MYVRTHQHMCARETGEVRVIDTQPVMASAALHPLRLHGVVSKRLRVNVLQVAVTDA